jgi:hypothetical protein
MLSQAYFSLNLVILPFSYDTDIFSNKLIIDRSKWWLTHMYANRIENGQPVHIISEVWQDCLVVWVPCEIEFSSTRTLLDRMPKNDAVAGLDSSKFNVNYCVI